jgi:hypothetical protein
MHCEVVQFQTGWIVEVEEDTKKEVFIFTDETRKNAFVLEKTCIACSSLIAKVRALQDETIHKKPRVFEDYEYRLGDFSSWRLKNMQAFVEQVVNPLKLGEPFTSAMYKLFQTVEVANLGKPLTKVSEKVVTYIP